MVCGLYPEPTPTSVMRSKLLVRVPMNRLDPEKLLELLVTVSKAIYQKPKYLRW